MSLPEGFSYRNGTLHCSAASLADIAAATGSPVWVYNFDVIAARCQEQRNAFNGLQHKLCYAVKANSSLALLQLLVREGCGFDVASYGELYRCLKAGADPSQIIMTGVGKSRNDIDYALQSGIALFNVESISECTLINEIALAYGTRANIVLRLNPDIETDTHPYIATGGAAHKFGLSRNDIQRLVAEIHTMPGLRISGLSFHLGSQIKSPQPYRTALTMLSYLLDDISRQLPETAAIIDIGGGFAVPYSETEAALSPSEIAAVIQETLGSKLQSVQVMTEPGRSLVARAGVLLTSVEHIKVSSSQRRFVIVDAGMNDLLRPALYQAQHTIVPVAYSNTDDMLFCDVVGPVCESSDVFLRDCWLPADIQRGQLLSILTAGAYGASMSSTYNSRPLAAEVAVSEGSWKIIRKRQSLDDMLRNETLF